MLNSLSSIITKIRSKINCLTQLNYSRNYIKIKLKPKLFKLNRHRNRNVLLLQSVIVTTVF